MTNEERDIITRFIERVGGADPAPAPAAGRGSVPGTAPAARPLPAVDAEADRLIGEMFARFPEARYRITQMAFVQEHAMAEAQNRIARLEWELEQAKAQPKGAFGGLFGGGAQRGPATPPPQPVQAPGYQPGMFQRAGGMGFLGTAAATAMGIGGGMLLGNALMGMFSGGAAHAATATEGLASAASSPWTNPAESPWAGPAKEDVAADAQDAGEEKSAWGEPAQDGGWDSADTGADDGGGWDEEV